jgi:hypothetical protein
MEQMDHSDPQARPRHRGGFMDTVKSKMGFLQQRVYRFDDAVSSSTFGRIFRLRGSGHVC